MDNDTALLLKGYAKSLEPKMFRAYSIPADEYDDNVKRGLRNSDGTGVIIGISKIGSVRGYTVEDGMREPQPGRLYYRGISIEDIVAAHKKENSFGYEEVSYLLLCGTLPTRSDMEMFNLALSKAKALPDGFFEKEIFACPSKNIMNTLGRCVLALYNYDKYPDDLSLQSSLMQSIELIAKIPTIIAGAYATKMHHFEGTSLYLHNPKEHLHLAENFLRLTRIDKSFTDSEAKLLDTLLMLHAEHSGGNNSAFTCRSVASTGSDIYSAISAAIGSLKGPLHGGANAAVMHMIGDIHAHVKDVRDDDEVGAYLDKILDGEAADRSGIIYGLGHAVYTLSDPRAVILKGMIKEMAEAKGLTDEYEIAERVERLGIPKIRERKGMSAPMCANVDLYSGLVYSLLGIPEDLYTPLFAAARTAGWCAHRMEEIYGGCRIMRPAYRYALHKKLEYIPIKERE